MRRAKSWGMKLLKGLGVSIVGGVVVAFALAGVSLIVDGFVYLVLGFWRLEPITILWWGFGSLIAGRICFGFLGAIFGEKTRARKKEGHNKTWRSLAPFRRSFSIIISKK